MRKKWLWKKLDKTIQDILKKKLQERLKSPHVASSRLSGLANHYKIKLRASGYRLVYEVVESKIYVLVIAIGKREKRANSEKLLHITMALVLNYAKMLMINLIF